VTDTKTFKIALLAGDGIGPEILSEAKKVMDAVQADGQVAFECVEAPFGGDGYHKTGKAFPNETIEVCDDADAILKGPIGLSKEESELIPVDERPERGGLLPMRRRYDTFANYRPVYLPRGLSHFSPLKAGGGRRRDRSADDQGAGGWTLLWPQGTGQERSREPFRARNPRV
tara:strand:- start:669 stop:1184 length:516 start_codon:yes stop_codon:yes gene_type:complete